MLVTCKIIQWQKLFNVDLEFTLSFKAWIERLLPPHCTLSAPMYARAGWQTLMCSVWWELTYCEVTSKTDVKEDMARCARSRCICGHVIYRNRKDWKRLLSRTHTRTHINVYTVYTHTGCPRKNVPDFGRVFLMLKYTDINQNTYVQSWTVTEIMAREFWNFDSCYTFIDYQIHIKTGRNMWFL